MKYLLSLLIAAAAGFSYAGTQDEKDHSSNASRIAGLSYYLADSAEMLAEESRYTYYYEIYREAEGVHRAASQLYHLARRGSQVPSYRFEQAFNTVHYEYKQLEYYFHDKNHDLDRYWYSVQARYQQLCSLMVNGFGLLDHRCD